VPSQGVVGPLSSRVDAQGFGEEGTRRMRRPWITVVFFAAISAAGCNHWDEYPYGNPYYQPYYQPPPYYQQPSYSAPPTPTYPSGTTYAQPSVGPCTPAAVKTTPTR